MSCAQPPTRRRAPAMTHDHGQHHPSSPKNRILVCPLSPWQGDDCYVSGSTSREKTMVTTVIGGAMLPHAPQFFTMPPTEDRANVERVRAVAATIGEKLRALKPDLWIIFSNDHAEQF